jgi:hypothetical protein
MVWHRRPVAGPAGWPAPLLPNGLSPEGLAVVLRTDAGGSRDLGEYYCRVPSCQWKRVGVVRSLAYAHCGKEHPDCRAQLVRLHPFPHARKRWAFPAGIVPQGWFVHPRFSIVRMPKGRVDWVLSCREPDVREGRALRDTVLSAVYLASSGGSEASEGSAPSEPTGEE